MKQVIYILLLLVGQTLFAAGGTSTIGEPAGLQDIEIVWLAPTNNWPDKLWSYKVIPQEFSPAVISNLLALGPFTMKDQTNMLGEPPFKDKSILYFRNADQSKYLGIYPSQGWIDYHDGHAEASSQMQPVVGVPNESETTQLGLKYLRVMGIDVSQLARKPGTDALDLHWERDTIGYMDQTNHRDVTLTNGFGVYFLRRVDGINMFGNGGNGGMRITFGNNAKVHDLQILWRNLKPHALVDIVPPSQVLAWLRSGKVPMPRLVGSPGAFKKVKITKAVPLYEANPEDKPMDYVFPFLRLEAYTDTGIGTNGFWFPAPIISKVPPGCEHSVSFKAP